MLERLLLLDAAARAWATTHHAPWADVLMAALSSVGRGGAVWIAVGTAAALCRPRLRPLLWQLILAVLLAHVAVDLVLKPSIARSRPFQSVLDARVVGARPATYAFPSGHAASAVAGAFVTTIMLPRMRGVLWALAVLIALSRIYVGVHYPLDVVVGAALGLAIGVLVTGGRAWYIHASSAAQDQWRGSSVGRAPD
jgi:undecaprenyl-diphosphatase